MLNELPGTDRLRRGLNLFFSGIIALGLVLLWFSLGRFILRDYRVAYVYEEAQAKILDFKTIDRSASSKRGYRSSRSATSCPLFTFRFEAEGKTVTTAGYDSFDGRDATPSDYSHLRVGQTVPCWYDPADPKQAVLVTDWYPRRYLKGCAPLIFVFLAGIFLVGINGKPRRSRTL